MLCSFAVKMIAKRWAPETHMEPLFVRRIQHEVDICNHIGERANQYVHGTSDVPLNMSAYTAAVSYDIGAYVAQS